MNLGSLRPGRIDSVGRTDDAATGFQVRVLGLADQSLGSPPHGVQPAVGAFYIGLFGLELLVGRH